MLLYLYFFMSPTGEEVAFYARSEAEARKDYEEFYNHEAGALTRRENW